jgi:hypothetical protein
MGHGSRVFTRTCKPLQQKELSVAQQPEMAAPEDALRPAMGVLAHWRW